MRTHKWKFIFLGIFFGIALLGLVPRSANVPLSNGDCAHITRASFCRSLFSEANSTISYKPKVGEAGSIVLWQSAFDGVVTLISATDSNVLFCLYDYDTGFRLFRVDTGKVFKTPAQGSDLNRILFTCTWEIEDGSPADWQEVLKYLHKVSPKTFAHQTVPVGMRFYKTPQSILRLLDYQGVKLAANQ
jgi:hypothetical protein